MILSVNQIGCLIIMIISLILIYKSHEKKKQIMFIIYRKEDLNPSERNSPFIFGKIQTAPAAINNWEKLFLPNQIS